ncbi:MAG: phosphopentomutase [Caldiserica bacterium]|nr:MAG: phosphopentomutase [Caldisericota bacterium]
MKRVILIVLDSVGVGYMRDAKKFNDWGANTLGHLRDYFGKLDLPELEKMGLSRIIDLRSGRRIIPEGSFGKMKEKSNAKDTIVGHWELMGIISKKGFPLYPNGFPKSIIRKFEKRIGRKVLGNKPCSGTVIIEELGKRHMETGYPIVYTSADSVFQIAAHEKIVPLRTLYKWCRIAREILSGKHRIGRIIARPFIGRPGKFKRTYNRKDFSVSPPKKTLLDYLKEKRIKTVGIGKIGDIFAHKGLSIEIHTEGNRDGTLKTIKAIKEIKEKSFIFTNLVDFDSNYGHRRNPEGYYNALKEFDSFLPEIKKNMKENDILIITADHGCDPLYKKHTDHTREHVPLLVYGERIKVKNLGIRESFCDVARTIDEYFGVGKIKTGKSFLKEVLKS